MDRIQNIGFPGSVGPGEAIDVGREVQSQVRVRTKLRELKTGKERVIQV